jgi:hypothetical protein
VAPGFTVSRTGTENVVAATLSVVPSAEVLAIVRYDDPPGEVPVDLAPYVVPGLEGTHDWLLTDDALAFGDPTVPQRFGEWRATWERTWMLDAYSSIVRLTAGPVDPKPFERLVSDSIDTDAGRIVPPDLLEAMIDEGIDEIDLSVADGLDVVVAVGGNRRVERQHVRRREVDRERGGGRRLHGGDCPAFRWRRSQS